MAGRLAKFVFSVAMLTFAVQAAEGTQGDDPADATVKTGDSPQAVNDAIVETAVELEETEKRARRWGGKKEDSSTKKSPADLK